MIGHGIEHDIFYSLGKQAVHHLFGRLAVDLGHEVFPATDALVDAGEDVQLVLIADKNRISWISLKTGFLSERLTICLF